MASDAFVGHSVEMNNSAIDSCIAKVKPLDHAVITQSIFASVPISNLVALYTSTHPNNCLTYRTWSNWVAKEVGGGSTTRTTERAARAAFNVFKVFWRQRDSLPGQSSDAVPIEEFVLFIYLQRAGFLSLRDRAATDDEWIDSEERSQQDGKSSPTATFSPSNTPAQTTCHSFVVQHLHEIFQLLRSATHLSAQDYVLSRRAVDALDFIVDIYMVDPQTREHHQSSIALAFAAVCGTRRDRRAGNHEMQASEDVQASELLGWLSDCLRRGVVPPDTDSNARSPNARDVVYGAAHRALCLPPAAPSHQATLFIDGCSNLQLFAFRGYRHVTITNCRSCVLYLSAVACTIRVDRCKKTTVITSCGMLQIGRSEDCTLFFQTMFPAVVYGSSQNLHLAPLNAIHKGAAELQRTCKLDFTSSASQWETPLVLHATATWALFPPSRFYQLQLPEVPGITERGATSPEEMLTVPPPYQAALDTAAGRVAHTRAVLEDPEISRSDRQRFAEDMEAQFVDWLVTSGQGRSVNDALH
eukprot:m.523883 g.523883  ORF g.523883 m.523883 type:complete len:528 (-) comp21982_c0_seq3:877-2460(-)